MVGLANNNDDLNYLDEYSGQCGINMVFTCGNSNYELMPGGGGMKCPHVHQTVGLLSYQQIPEGISISKDSTDDAVTMLSQDPDSPFCQSP